MQDDRTYTDTDPRALFGARRAELSDTRFSGIEALNRAGELSLTDSTFSSPLPLSHVTDAIIRGCTFEEGAVSPLRAARTVTLQGCTMNAPRGCEMSESITIDACRITSSAFGEKSVEMTLSDTVLSGEACLSYAVDLSVSNIDLTSNGAMRYAAGGTIDFSTLTGEDLLFGAKNITISDTVLDGSRIGWYSENITLDHCVISGQRPFAYAKNLRLIDCALDPSCTDAFERSTLDATLRGKLHSVRNPAHGSIIADELGEVVFDDTAAIGTDCMVKAKG